MNICKKVFLAPIAAVVLAACGTTESSSERQESAIPDTSDIEEAPSIHKGDMVETTIPIENSENWVEEAAEYTEAVSGDTYVQLDQGVLTVNQINYLLKNLPMEVTFADENSQFLYFNSRNEPEEMLAPRAVEQVGDALTEGHPEEAQKNMQRALDLFYAGEIESFQRVASTDDGIFKVVSYQAVHDEEGEYRGINQYAQDIQPIIDYYLEETGMMLVEDPDAVTGATTDE